MLILRLIGGDEVQVFVYLQQKTKASGVFIVGLVIYLLFNLFDLLEISLACFNAAACYFTLKASALNALHIHRFAYVRKHVDFEYL